MLRESLLYYVALLSLKNATITNSPLKMPVYSNRYMIFPSNEKQFIAFSIAPEVLQKNGTCKNNVITCSQRRRILQDEALQQPVAMTTNVGL